jgi:hypothetical protein
MLLTDHSLAQLDDTYLETLSPPELRVLAGKVTVQTLPRNQGNQAAVGSPGTGCPRRPWVIEIAPRGDGVFAAGLNDAGQLGKRGIPHRLMKYLITLDPIARGASKSWGSRLSRLEV